MEKLTVKRAVIVEGKYDKIKLSQLIDGVILATDGFGVFGNSELRSLIRFYAGKCGLIVMTDSDAAGRRIRAYIKSILPKEYAENVINVHIPKITGKEKRKENYSKERTLGVEGIDSRILYDLLKKSGCDAQPYARKNAITKYDMYALGLSGSKNAYEKRRLISQAAGLPEGLSSSALLDALNSLYTLPELCELIETEKW